MSRTRIRAAIAAGASAVALVALAAPSAQADLLSVNPNTCGNAPTSQPFRAWGDLASYTLVPGGAFEAGDQAWSLSGGAAIKDGNESYYVYGTSDQRSLALPPGSSATSPAMCTSVARPTLRFFVRNGGSPLSSLKVDVYYRGLLGNISLFQLGVISGSNWTPSLPMPVLASLVSTLPGSSTSLAFRFTPLGSGGNWSIDDVYVDPMSRR